MDEHQFVVGLCPQAFDTTLRQCNGHGECKEFAAGQVVSSKEKGVQQGLAVAMMIVDFKVRKYLIKILATFKWDVVRHPCRTLLLPGEGCYLRTTILKEVLKCATHYTSM